HRSSPRHAYRRWRCGSGTRIEESSVKLDRKLLTAMVFLGLVISMLQAGIGETNRTAGHPARKKSELTHGMVKCVSGGDVERIKQYLDADPALLADGLALGGKPSWSDGSTLLHFAVRFGQLGVVEELLRRGGDVNVRVISRNEKRRGETPLHVAAGNG